MLEITIGSLALWKVQCENQVEIPTQRYCTENPNKTLELHSQPNAKQSETTITKATTRQLSTIKASGFSKPSLYA